MTQSKFQHGSYPDEIIDAHHHWWNPVTKDPDIGYVWLTNIGAPKPFGDPTPIQRDYLAEEFLNEASPCKIVGSVHLQADGAIPDPIAETKFVDALAKAKNHLLGIVGFVDLSAAEAAELIKQHMDASSSFRGVRQILSKMPERPDISFAKTEFIRDDKWRDQFQLLSENRLSFDLQCYPEQMPEIAEFLALHEGVPVIIDHAGSPWDQSEAGLKRWQEGMQTLATLPQVTVKLCGLGMFNTDWNAGNIQTMFSKMEEMFGPNRMMFGSNFPVDKLMRNYSDILQDMGQLTAGWDKQARDAFFVGNAKRIYQIETGT